MMLPAAAATLAAAGRLATRNYARSAMLLQVSPTEVPPPLPPSSDALATTQMETPLPSLERPAAAAAAAAHPKPPQKHGYRPRKKKRPDLIVPGLLSSAERHHRPGGQRSPPRFRDQLVTRHPELPSQQKMERQATEFLAQAVIEIEGKTKNDHKSRNEADFPDWQKAMVAIEAAEEEYPVKKYAEEELEAIKDRVITHNLAKVVNDSPTLKSLVDLGVNLSKWETLGLTDMALGLDYKRDVEPKVRFLAKHGVGTLVEEGRNVTSQLGYVLDRNPYLLQQTISLVQMQEGVGYLKGKNFTKWQIAQILSFNPWWLNYEVQEIDRRLGYFQTNFKLTGLQVRSVTVQLPSLITWGGVPAQILRNHFALYDLMGFSPGQCKHLLLKCPQLYKSRVEDQLVEVFDVLHNKAGYSHDLLARFPSVLTSKPLPIKQRLAFLKKLGRDKFDPEQPNYVSPKALAEYDDKEFCEKAAKVDESTFDAYLMTI